MSVFKRWNGTSWEVVGPQISSTRFDDTNHMVAPEYSSTNIYNVGDYVVQSDKLYRCISAIEEIEEWTPAHWTQVAMGGEVSDLKSALDWNGNYNADVSGILGSASVNNLSVTGKNDVFQYLFHINIDAGIKYTFGIKLGDTPTQAVYFYIIDTDNNYIETSGSFMAINDGITHTKDKTFESAHKNAVIAIKSRYDCMIDYAYAKCSTNIETKLIDLFYQADESSKNFESITAYKVESERQLTTTSGYMSTFGEMKTGSNYATLSVSKGDIYSIKAMTGSNVHAYVLIKDGAVVDYYTPTDTWETAHNFDIVFKATADGTLYINTIKSYYIGAHKLDIVCDCQHTVDNNAKGVSDALELNDSQNLFIPTEYNVGYRQGTSIINNESYTYSKPIWLTAGDYLYTSVSSLVGNSDRVYLVDKFGVLQGTTTSSVSIVPENIGSISEYGIYSNRDINKFTLPNDSYVSLNLGYVSSTTKTSPQISNFMLVSGSLLSDFPMYDKGYVPYYTIKTATVNGLSGLRGKMVIFDGDSICQGITVGDSDPTYGFGWAGRIGNANAMHWVNAGIGGGVITSASNPLCANKHSVVDNVDVLFASYPETDYYVFDGGCNDADLLGNAIQDPSVMGSYDLLDFSGSYDVTTFSGAFETIIYKAISHWKLNHIGYIIPQKMGNSNGYSAMASNYRAYYERAIAICEKWGIPYLDLWNGCYLNPKNPLCRDSSLTPEQSIAQGYLYVDSQHLSAKGYDKITPMIETWMKTL